MYLLPLWGHLQPSRGSQTLQACYREILAVATELYTHAMALQNKLQDS